MYILKNNTGAVVTGFTPTGLFQTISSRDALKWHSLSDLIKYLRCQPQVSSITPSTLKIYRIVEQPVEILTEEVV